MELENFFLKDLSNFLLSQTVLVPEVLMKGESCKARSPLVSSVLSLTVNN